jgi:predicted Fe-Mo cluster-binding NifX family protein
MPMTTVAMPTYGSRVAPVCDFADCFLLIQLKHNCEVKRTVLHLEGLPHVNRVGILKRVGVTTLICAGISELSQTMLEGSGIRVFWGVVGEVEDVFAAFIDNRLDEPQFYMPGLGHKHGSSTNVSATHVEGADSKDTKTRQWG